MLISEKYSEECWAAGFEYVGRSSRVGYSRVQCMVCGHEGEYRQDAIRRGEVRCGACHKTKMINECLACNFTYLGKGSRVGYSIVKCNVCEGVGEFDQGAIRRGEVRCGVCQITKYKQSTKDGWTFDSHFSDGRTTYVNLKHNCCDDLVKVQASNYLNGEYSCPNCIHTHFSDPSYFYVIQVGDIIKLGISNRPARRYSKYGLPDDATIIEHLRIPLETKRDALVVESYAKALVKDYKLPTDVAKQVFAQSGYNECYSIESLDHLLTI